MRTRVYIIEDSLDIAENITHRIINSDDFTLVGLSHSGKEGLRDISQKKPELLILDVGLPDIKGTELITPLKEQMPQLKILIFTVFEDEETILEAIQKGANGYILKETPETLFFAELNVVMLGGASLTPRIATKISDLYNLSKSESTNNGISVEEPLSERQEEILNFIVLGFSYKEIADELSISPHTVRRHIENIYQKLNVNKRTEAIRKYHQRMEA